MSNTYDEFWSAEAGRVSSILNDTLHQTSSLTERTYPFVVMPRYLANKAEAAETFRILYRDLIWKVIEQLSAEKLYLLEIASASFNRSPDLDNPGAVTSINLQIRVAKIHSEAPAWQAQ